MKRIAYIIPGFPHDIQDSSYQTIAQLFAIKNIEPVSISINWKETTFNDWVSEARSNFIHTKQDQVWVFGFSIGAMIALKVASEIKPQSYSWLQCRLIFKKILVFCLSLGIKL